MKFPKLCRSPTTFSNYNNKGTGCRYNRFSPFLERVLLCRVINFGHTSNLIRLLLICFTLGLSQSWASSLVSVAPMFFCALLEEANIFSFKGRVRSWARTMACSLILLLDPLCSNGNRLYMSALLVGISDQYCFSSQTGALSNLQRKRKCYYHHYSFRC